MSPQIYLYLPPSTRITGTCPADEGAGYLNPGPHLVRQPLHSLSHLLTHPQSVSPDAC